MVVKDYNKPGWLFGCYQGRFGSFPSIYVNVIGSAERLNFNQKKAVRKILYKK